jgi:hypothetical protein
MLWKPHCRVSRGLLLHLDPLEATEVLQDMPRRRTTNRRPCTACTRGPSVPAMLAPCWRGGLYCEVMRLHGQSCCNAVRCCRAALQSYDAGLTADPLQRWRTWMHWKAVCASLSCSLLALRWGLNSTSGPAKHSGPILMVRPSGRVQDLVSTVASRANYEHHDCELRLGQGRGGGTAANTSCGRPAVSYSQQAGGGEQPVAPSAGERDALPHWLVCHPAVV